MHTPSDDSPWELIIKAKTIMDQIAADNSDDATHEAVELLSAAIDLAPDIPLAHYYLGIIADTTQADPDTALLNFQITVDLDDHFGDAHARIGSLFYIESNYTQALHHLNRAIKCNPLHETPLLYQAAAFLKTDRTNQAFDSLHKAEALTPNNPTIHLLRAIAHIHEWQESYCESSFSEAVDDLNSASNETFPGFAGAQELLYRAYMERGLIRLANDTPELSIRDYNQAISESYSGDSLGAAYLGLSNALRKAQRYDEATTYYCLASKCLRHPPSFQNRKTTIKTDKQLETITACDKASLLLSGSTDSHIWSIDDTYGSIKLQGVLLKAHPVSASSTAAAFKRIVTGSHEGILSFFFPSASGVSKGRNSSASLILPRYQVEAHVGTINQIAISQDNRIAASASDDASIAIWNIGDATILHRLRGHEGAVRTVDISPDGRLLVSGGADSFIRIWDLTDGTNVFCLKNSLTEITHAKFSPNGKFVVSGDSQGFIRVINMTHRRETALFKGHEGRINTVAVSPQAGLILSGGSDGIVQLWNPAGDKLRSYEGHSDEIIFLQFWRANCSLALSCARSGEIRFWDLMNDPDIEP